ncbi:MAG: hypothetical protein PHQ12_06060 [Chthoniobacteraceae bacterium]|nr:hypothetical protein [Chthoniobacteraceae bacterium]
MKPVLFAAAVLAAASALSGCATLSESKSVTTARAAMNAEIQAEPPGDYYIARRYYKTDYKFWGYVRKPRQPWTTAKLVMLNENQKLAPDRDQGTLGIDNGYEYKLTGSFSGATIYEPASNGFYPEFVLKSYTLRNVDPAPIFTPQGPALDPNRRVIVSPY